MKLFIRGIACGITYGIAIGMAILLIALYFTNEFREGMSPGTLVQLQSTHVDSFTDKCSNSKSVNDIIYDNLTRQGILNMTQ